MRDAVRSISVVRVSRDGVEDATDHVAVEAPLEVRLHGEPFSVIMRTPGADRDLTAGFLFSESIILGPDDIAALDEDESAGIVNVTLAPNRAAILPDLAGTRRQVAMNSSCGMCGRRTLESLDIPGDPLTAGWTMAATVVAGMPARLRDAQAAFALTGGLHAAGLFTVDGHLDATAEDVGRHNAVDKLVGRMLLLRRLPLDRLALAVSGRSSFEIVQKAFLAGIPLVVAVSAPSSLAVDLADRCGITLVGFARDGRFNVYSHAGRVAAGVS